MEQTTNIILQDDNTITKLNGLYTYFTPVSGTLVNLHLYQNVLLAAFTTKMSYFTDTGSTPNQTGVLTDLTGASFTVTAPRITRAVGQSGNFYWTSDAGVMKIDAYNGKVFKAGTPPALDLRGGFFPRTGVFNPNTEVGYRVLFGRRDANANEILSSPSDTLILSNSKVVGVSWSRTTNVTTVTSPGHNLVNGFVITVSNSTGGTPVAAGDYSITVDDLNTFHFPNAAANSSGTLDYTVTREAYLEFSVPREITTTADGYFYQVFRTSPSNRSSATPSPDFKLIEEVQLTAAQISAGVVFYEDDTDEVLLTNAPELYTNPNSQEGELQANARPPLCDDVTLFQNYVFYGNATTRQILNVNVVAAVDLTDNDYVEIKVDATTRRYVAKSNVGNNTVKSESVTNSGGDILITYTNHGFSNGYTVYISQSQNPDVRGTYYVVSAAGNSFKISLTNGGTPVAYPASLTSLYFEGVTDGTYPIFYLDLLSSVSVQLRNTAQSIVRAINRDASSLVYANYISAIDDTPGMMRITAVGFTGVIYMRANTDAAGAGFSPTLPSSFASGTQVNSSGSSQPNSVYISKVGEPEAVPVVNNLQIGSKNKAILRIIALRDSIIVLKEDGVFKIVGDNPQNFTSILLDNTVLVISANSGALLNNQVYFLANQGICVATDSAVQIVSRRIERLIEPIVGNSNITTQTGAVGYESNRTYRICTLLPSGTVSEVVYLHNTINDTWTDSDILFKAGTVGPNNTLYLVSSTNTVLKERKVGDRTDYCGQNHTITVVSVTSTLFGASITTTGAYAPNIGDIIIKNSVFSRIRTVTGAGSNWTVTFSKPTNLAAADTPIAYERVISTVKMAPFHAGMMGRTKQFAQFQIHCRTYNITRLLVTFAGQSLAGSAQTTWLDTNVIGASGGWGFEPWGFFAWGEQDGIALITTTAPAPIIRLPVPIQQQRGTFIQPILEHQEAGESMDIQAQSWALRPYQERVSK